MVALGAVHFPSFRLFRRVILIRLRTIFRADYRLSRPIRIWKESWVLEPSISFFNVFNNSPKGQYSGLAIPNCRGSTDSDATADCPNVNYRNNRSWQFCGCDRQGRGSRSSFAMSADFRKQDANCSLVFGLRSRLQRPIELNGMGVCALPFLFVASYIFRPRLKLIIVTYVNLCPNASIGIRSITLSISTRIRLRDGCWWR